MLGIRLAKALSIKSLELWCDSQLLVSYIRGEYKVKKRKNSSIYDSSRVAYRLVYKI